MDFLRQRNQPHAQTGHEDFGKAFDIKENNFDMSSFFTIDQNKMKNVLTTVGDAFTIMLNIVFVCRKVW